MRAVQQVIQGRQQVQGLNNCPVAGRRGAGTSAEAPPSHAMTLRRRTGKPMLQKSILPAKAWRTNRLCGASADAQFAPSQPNHQAEPTLRRHHQPSEPRQSLPPPGLNLSPSRFSPPPCASPGRPGPTFPPLRPALPGDRLPPPGQAAIAAVTLGAQPPAVGGGLCADGELANHLRGLGRAAGGGLGCQAAAGLCRQRKGRRPRALAPGRPAAGDVPGV